MPFPSPSGFGQGLPPPGSPMPYSAPVTPPAPSMPFAEPAAVSRVVGSPLPRMGVPAGSEMVLYRSAANPAFRAATASEGAVSAVSKLGGRLVLPLAALGATVAIMEALAPAVQSWIRGQSAELEQKLGEPLVRGGQCATRYRLRIQVDQKDQESYVNTWLTALGPIRGMDVRQGTNWFGQPAAYVYLLSSQANGEPWEDYIGFFDPKATATVSITGRVDGEADNCGDRTGQPQRNPEYDKAQEQQDRKFGFPWPYRNPFEDELKPGEQRELKKVPFYKIGNPSDGWRTGDDPREAWKPPDWDWGRTGEGRNEKERYRVPGAEDIPRIPPDTTDRKPPPDKTQKPKEEDCWNKCLDAIWDKLEEIEKKLEPKPDPKLKPYELRFPYVLCVENDDGTHTPQLKTAWVKAVDHFPGNLPDLLEAEAKGAVLGCLDSAPVASIPEWWQVRLGAVRPQLVITFRRGGTRQYNQLCIPHPRNTAPLSKSPFPAYVKGSSMGMLTLLDNSKFICYAVNPGNAGSLVAIARSLISPAMIGPDPLIKITEAKGYPLANDVMTPVSAAYFPEGQKQLKPAWRVRFKTQG